MHKKHEEKRPVVGLLAFLDRCFPWENRITGYFRGFFADYLEIGVLVQRNRTGLKFLGGCPITNSTGSPRARRPEGLLREVPVMATSNRAGVEIGMSPD